MRYKDKNPQKPGEKFKNMFLNVQDHAQYLC